jgi:hypothetical protein
MIMMMGERNWGLQHLHSGIWMLLLENGIERRRWIIGWNMVSRLMNLGELVWLEV